MYRVKRIFEDIEPWSKSPNYIPGKKDIEPAIDNELLQDCIDRMTDIKFGAEYKSALRKFNRGFEPKGVRYPKDFKGNLPYIYNKPID
jgi:hypothetical protein